MNDFAEALDEDTPCGKIARDALSHNMGHIGKGYEYYFPETVLSNITKHTVVAIHSQNLTQDLQAFLRYYDIPEVTAKVGVVHSDNDAYYPRKNDTHLSQSGRKKLLASLKREYDIYEQIDQASVDLSGKLKIVKGEKPHEPPRTEEECCASFG